MKYSAKQYAVALEAVLRETADNRQDEVISNFLQEVKRNRDDRHLAKIVDETIGLLVAARGGRRVMVELARKQDESSVSLIKRSFREEDRVDYKINPDLVAGLRVTFNGERELDHSLAYKIKTLFKK